MKRFATLLCLLTLAAAPAFAGHPTAASGVATAPAGHMGHMGHMVRCIGTCVCSRWTRS